MGAKKFLAFLLAVLTLVLAGCSTTRPCEECGDIPTKGYKNEQTGKKEYYCEECSSECPFCWDKADMHYTGGAGIVFICKDCYEDLKDYGWVG